MPCDASSQLCLIWVFFLQGTSQLGLISTLWATPEAYCRGFCKLLHSKPWLSACFPEPGRAAWLLAQPCLATRG
ncbi:hypothetical protein B0T10DRAFT_210406 [Thelonectria olida]|uniref:Secreted protein n=1 Tax=Thelonectria olida TaxID=1576542 RepID=A0A9P9ASW7_9HYPO|nr:hypothetical protein B0T10DRAFT_210406 [Thelonectria olida]